jgi:hypothetical protein
MDWIAGRHLHRSGDEHLERPLKYLLGAASKTMVKHS